VLAGVVLSVGWIKPHVFFPCVVVMVALLGWRVALRIVGGFLGATALLGAASWLLAGGPLFVAWIRELLDFGRTAAQAQPGLASLAGVYLSLLNPPWTRLAAVLLVAAWAGFALLLVRAARRARVTPDDDAWPRLVGLALAAWLLAAPYIHIPDMLLIGAALPALLGRQGQGLADGRVRLALGLLMAAPEADLLGLRLNYILCYSTLVPLAVIWALRPAALPADCPAAYAE
jgi:hypothetical protein